MPVFGPMDPVIGAESSSGARLYVKCGKARWEETNKVLLLVTSLLPETDVDREKANIVAIWGCNSEGIMLEHKWGEYTSSQEKDEAHERYSIPSAREWRSLTVDEKEAQVNCMMRWVDVYEVPNNSQVRVQIQHWLCEVAELKVHEADQAWLLAQEKAKSIQGPLPQEIVTPNPPTLSHLHIPPFLPAGRGSCVRILINRNCLGNVFFFVSTVCLCCIV